MSSPFFPLSFSQLEPMSSSRNAIDEALSPDDLGELSEIMFKKHSSSGAGSSFPEGEPPRSEQTPGTEKASSPAAASSEGGASKKTTSKKGATEKENEPSSKNTPGSSAAGAPRSKAPPRPASGTERPVERPSFTIFADQAATLRVLAGARADPLGATASDIAQRALDLLGYNGRHPAAALHGHTLSEGAPAPGPLIEARQWKDLLARAAEMAAEMTPASEPPSEGSFAEADLAGANVEKRAHLACLCFLVQEALYEAGFGDRRRRRKEPL